MKRKEKFKSNIFIKYRAFDLKKMLKLKGK